MCRIRASNDDDVVLFSVQIMAENARQRGFIHPRLSVELRKPDRKRLVTERVRESHAVVEEHFLDNDGAAQRRRSERTALRAHRLGTVTVRSPHTWLPEPRSSALLTVPCTR